MTDSDRKLAESLIDEGFQRLRRRDVDGAIQIGTRLTELRHTSGFEILALAYAAKGQTRKAISVLEEGVELAPNVWLLWQLLGNYYSEEERFEHSHDAYRAALDCPGVDEHSVRLNVGIVLKREGRLEEALRTLDQMGVAVEAIAARAEVVRLQILNQLERYDAAIQLAEKLQRRLRDASGELVASVCAEHALAIWNHTLNAEAALACAWRAVAHRADDPMALRLIRTIDGEVSESARYLRLLVRGRWTRNHPDGPLGFLRSYHVLADGVGDALQLVRRFEPEDVRDSLEVESCEDAGPRPGEPKGVYWLAGYTLFRLEEGRPDG